MASSGLPSIRSTEVVSSHADASRLVSPSRRGRSARSLRIASLAPATGRSGTLFDVAMYKSCALVGPAGSTSAAHKTSTKGGKRGVSMLGCASIGKQSRRGSSAAASARPASSRSYECLDWRNRLLLLCLWLYTQQVIYLRRERK